MMGRERKFVDTRENMVTDGDVVVLYTQPG